MKNILLAIIITVSILSLGACTTVNNKQYNSQEIADPIEPVNRAIFGFNDFIDKALLAPIAKIYKAVLPFPVRETVRSFIRNLKTPITLANNILQGDIEAAGNTLTRFTINSTLGMCGLFDVAHGYGFEYQEEDFGQTLAKWGAKDGFYLVLPILGPSSLRDTAGLAVDGFADPVRIVTNNTDNDWIYYTKSALEGVDTRSRLIEALDDLRNNNLDYYAAVRSAYSQKRISLINNKNPKHLTGNGSSYEDYEDYED